MKKLVTILAVWCILSAACASNLKVLFIGDSITDGGWGRSGGSDAPATERNLWDLNHLYGHGYVYLCVAHYQGEHPTLDVTFYNRGISGYTLMDLKNHWKENVLDIQPDVLSVLIGTNDVDRFLSQTPEASFDKVGWEKMYRELLDAALQQNPNLKIVLASPFIGNCGNIAKNNFSQRKELITQLGEIVKRIVSDYHAAYLDYSDMFAQLLNTYPKQPQSYWIWDGIHPTPAGHARMADMWINSVNEFILK